MTICLALQDELDKSIAQLDHVARCCEPEVTAPAELRTIMELVKQFKARPQEPLSFQLMHIDHLSASIDNADGAIEMWGVIDSCLADFYISKHYCNVHPAIQNNRFEIIPGLHKLVNETYEFICTGKADDEKAVEALRVQLMSQVDELSRFISSCS